MDSKPGSATYELHDLEQTALPLCATISASVTRGEPQSLHHEAALRMRRTSDENTESSPGAEHARAHWP